MADFLAFFLPMLAFQLMPVLLPLIGWAVGTAKDAIMIRRSADAHPGHARTTAEPSWRHAGAVAETP